VPTATRTVAGSILTVENQIADRPNKPPDDHASLVIASEAGDLVSFIWLKCVL